MVTETRNMPKIAGRNGNIPVNTGAPSLGELVAHFMDSCGHISHRCPFQSNGARLRGVPLSEPYEYLALE